MTAAETFATWALGLRLDDVPGDVAHAASRHLLDGLGCAIAAVRTGAAPFATALAPAAGAPVEMAAFANGVLVHALDYDDTHAGALVHATAAVLPAAFAVGEAAGSSGAEVLCAAITGYEVVIRLGAAVTHGFHARGFHATSVCGVFGAALVASRLLGLSERATVNALGIAGSAAAGSLEFLNTGSSTKQLHPGFSAMNGVAAARLAHAGAEGPDTIFEGPHGLYRSYLGVDVDPAALTEGLGRRWETTRITIKPYPACQLSHASLDALRACGAFEPADVERITFAVPDGVSTIVCGKPVPRTPYEGKFSLEYCAGALLADGDLTVASFEPEALERADVLGLAARVLWSDRPFDGAPADAPGICEVKLRDDTVMRGEVAKSRGGPDAPLSDDEVRAKFSANGGADALADDLLSLVEQPSIAQVLAQ
jgi:2-methylcitrate dehydratase PrpD